MKCLYYQNNQCRSCEYLDKSYEETIRLKVEALESLFPMDKGKIKESVGLSSGAGGSRYKAKLAVFNNQEKMEFGFYNKMGVFTELEKCPLHAPGINEILPDLKTNLEKYKIPAYDLKTKKGELKYILISKCENDILIRFILRSKESLDRLRIGTSELQKLLPQIKVVTANIQPVHQAIIEGDEEIILSKDKVIIHQFDEFKIGQGARSFFQVTPEIAKNLYDTLSQEIKKDRPKSLIDLYCGVGAFSFYASRWCPDVTGVEISSEAIDCAKMSALLNDRPINFYAMDVEAYLKQYPKKFDAVLVNPPRRGLNSSIIKSIKAINPEFIYYSSCNAETMERDFHEFSDFYEIQSLQLFDMFAFTSHYETLMCLKRK